MLSRHCLIFFMVCSCSIVANAQVQKPRQARENVEVKLTQEAYYPKGDKVLYKYIYRNLNLDTASVPKDLDTYVTLLFTVGLDSTIKDFKVLQDPSGLFAEPMKRLFKDTKFVPSEENNQPVVTKVLLKVPFSHEDLFLEQEHIQPVR